MATPKRSPGQTARRSTSKDWAAARRAGKFDPARFKAVPKASAPKPTAKPQTGIQRAMTTYGAVDSIVKGKKWTRR